MSKIIRLGESAPRSLFRGSSVAFGVFDGVHLGHRFLLGEACRSARETGGKSVALTFSVDPDELFAANRLVKLMGNDERIATLANTGVDVVAVIPFDETIANLDPMDFLVWAFGEAVPAFMHVGRGFRFGSKASGGIADMLVWGSGKGLLVCEHPLLEMHGAPVSSTRIRDLYAKSLDVEAESLLAPCEIDL